jgi:hypothetical protein
MCEKSEQSRESNAGCSLSELEKNICFTRKLSPSLV